MIGKARVPAVEGLFVMDEAEPSLLGARCRRCGAYFFPRATTFCRNPSCDGEDLQEVTLSRTGRIWSYTGAHYEPPAPFVAKRPFDPFAIAAVELDKEGLTILGQVADGIGLEALRVGMPMELVLRPLYEDDQHVYLTWSWKPVGEAGRA